MTVLTDTPEVLSEVYDERVSQVDKWGVQHHPDGTGHPADKMYADLARADTDAAAADGALTWRHILREEVYEAFAEGDPERLEVELTQVAAVAVAWKEDIRGRNHGANARRAA